MVSSLFAKTTIIDMGLARSIFFLAFLIAADYHIFPVNAASCGSSKLRYVFELHPSLNEFNGLLKLVQSAKSALIKRPEKEGLPVHVIVKPDDFHKFYRKSRALKVYRSHWTKCVETNKLKAPSIFNVEPISAPSSNEQTIDGKQMQILNKNSATEDGNVMNFNALEESETYRPEKLANDMNQPILVNQSQLAREEMPVKKQYLTTKRKLITKRKPKFRRFASQKKINLAKLRKCSSGGEKCKNSAFNATKKFVNPRAVTAKNIRKMRFISPHADRQRVTHKMRIKDTLEEEDKSLLNINSNPELIYRSAMESKNGQSSKILQARKTVDKKSKLKMKKKKDTMKKKMEKRLNGKRIHKVVKPERNSIEQQSLQKKKKRNIITKFFRKISKRTVSISNVEESRLQSIAKRALLKAKPILKLMTKNSTKFEKINREAERGRRNVVLGHLKEDKMAAKENISSIPRKTRRPVIMRKKYMHPVPGQKAEKHKSFRASASLNQHTLNSAEGERAKWRPFFGKEKKMKLLREKRQSPVDLNTEEFESNENFRDGQIPMEGTRYNLAQPNLEGEDRASN